MGDDKFPHLHVGIGVFNPRGLKDLSLIGETTPAPQVEAPSEWEQGKPLAPDCSVDDALDAICRIILNRDDDLRKLIHDVPNERLMIIADALEDQKDCVGFRVEARDIFADRLRAEVGYRKTLEEARAAQMSPYCPTCHGACDCGPEHDKNYLRKSPYKDKPKEVAQQILAIKSMHRRELIRELLKVKGLDEG